MLGDEIADMVFTDPPYNVNYANSAKDKMRGKDRAILNDNLGDGFYDFLLAALTPTVAHCQGGIYVAMSSANWTDCRPRSEGGRWSLVDLRHLGQEHFYPGAGRLPAPVRADPLRLARGADRHWCGDRDQGDVWQIKKPQKNDLHPTMKPVELVERAIRNSSRPGDVVLDPFGGSGTDDDRGPQVSPWGAADRTGSEVRGCDRAPLAGLCRGRPSGSRWRGVRRCRSAGNPQEVAAGDVGDVADVLELRRGSAGDDAAD